MKLSIFGIGYVGLVQAAIFADVGYDVLCVDIDDKKVNDLKNGIIPIYEPGLALIVKENYSAGRLNFTTNAEEAVSHAEIQFIAVGTPPDENGSADLQYVLSVAETIANHMNDSKIIIDKSTVPVGTADLVYEKVSTVLEKRGVDYSFEVVSNPEFLKEGAAVEDSKRPERIIIGTGSKKIEKKMRELYAPFNRNRDRMIFMDVRSAELTKYAANCMLATKISFMNEMANIAEKLGADIENVRKGIGSDSRIGYHFIYPGCGYGGSCFPKDVQALIRTASGSECDSHILNAVEHVNFLQKEKLFQKIKAHYNNDIKGKTFAVWGLSFKPNTDDMRDAPSRILMQALWDAGAKVQAFDPESMIECQRIYKQRDDLRLMGTKEEALKTADALVICTEWNQFRAPDFQLIGSLISDEVIFDGRNMYDSEIANQYGLKYYSMGRQTI